MKNTDGFSISGIILAIVVIGVIGAGGYLAVKHMHNKKNASPVTSSVQKPAKNESDTTSSRSQQQYLVVTRWGVKLPVSGVISDAYYAVPTGISNDADGAPSSISLGVTSLDSSCGVVSSSNQGTENSLGSIVRVSPAATDPVSGEPYTQLDPGGVTINGYYYGYADANIKDKTCASSTTLNDIATAFTDATGEIKTD